MKGLEAYTSKRSFWQYRLIEIRMSYWVAVDFNYLEKYKKWIQTIFIIYYLLFVQHFMVIHKMSYFIGLLQVSR